MKSRIIALLFACGIFVYAAEPQTYQGVRVLRDADFIQLPDVLTVSELTERFGMPSRTEILGVGVYLRYSSEIDYANSSYEKVWASFYVVCSKEDRITTIVSSEGKVVWPKSLSEKSKNEEKKTKAAEPGATAQRL